MKVWVIEMWDEGVQYVTKVVDSEAKAKILCDNTEGWYSYAEYEVE